MACVNGHDSVFNHVDKDRLFHFGETVCQDFPEGDRLRICVDCKRFTTLCCSHNRGRSLGTVCHATQVAYFATSCKYSGRPFASAGFGIAIGYRPDDQEWSIPVDVRLDEGHNRTNNRTDLLATCECLRKLAFAYNNPASPCAARPETWIVASSSDYVIKNYTQHFENWRKKGWKKSGGGQLANLDLWFCLHTMVVDFEDDFGIRIAFYRTRKDENAARVTKLAKAAVELAGSKLDPAAVLTYYVGALSLVGEDVAPASGQGLRRS